MKESEAIAPRRISKRSAETRLIFRVNKANKLLRLNHLIQKSNQNKPNFHPFLRPNRPQSKSGR